MEEWIELLRKHVKTMPCFSCIVQVPCSVVVATDKYLSEICVTTLRTGRKEETKLFFLW